MLVIHSTGGNCGIDIDDASLTGIRELAEKVCFSIKDLRAAEQRPDLFVLPSSFFPQAAWDLHKAMHEKLVGLHSTRE